MSLFCSNIFLISSTKGPEDYYAQISCWFPEAKGRIFILWNYDESVDYSVSHMNTQKLLEKAPIHSLAAERKLRALDQRPISLPVHL